MMKRAIRKAGALGVFMAILAGMVFGIGMPRIAEAHGTVIADKTQSPLTFPVQMEIETIPMPRGGFVLIIQRAAIVANLRHNVEVYSADKTSLLTRARTWVLYESHPASFDFTPDFAGVPNVNPWLNEHTSFLIRVTTLPVDEYDRDTIQINGVPVSASVQEISYTVPGNETPTTPDPETPKCTYKHRLIGVPGTTGGGYTSQILISSEESNATATITAYQNDNGHQIDVLSDGSAIGSSVSLAPAHSVKVFRLEDARGWHTVIVEHPTARAMRRATVAMRLREPDTGVSIILAERIEDCEPVATTTE